MGGRVRIDLAELEVAISHIGGLLDYLDSIVGNIDTAVGILHGSWTGTSADAHHQTHLLWMKDATTLRSSLTNIHSELTVALKSYESARDANKSMFGGS